MGQRRRCKLRQVGCGDCVELERGIKRSKFLFLSYPDFTSITREIWTALEEENADFQPFGNTVLVDMFSTSA